jgi:four helix bundle protein
MVESNPVRCYRDLNVWQRAIDLTVDVYRLTTGFPKHEIYGLSSQMQRAAVSIPSNIAEGHARDSTKEYLHHLSIAAGSQAELETQLIIAGRLGYLTETQVADSLAVTENIGRMNFGLQRSLKAKL